MARGWIQDLANEVKESGHTGATHFQHDRHVTRVIQAKGQPFFTSVAQCLAVDLQEMSTALKGTPTDIPTTVQEPSPHQISIARECFPTIQATLSYANPAITFSNIRNTATVEGGDFNFQVDVDNSDALSLQQMFGDEPMLFRTPGEFSRFLVQMMFRAQALPRRDHVASH
jgi:hypothetical protein